MLLCGKSQGVEEIADRRKRRGGGGGKEKSHPRRHTTREKQGATVVATFFICKRKGKNLLRVRLVFGVALHGRTHGGKKDTFNFNLKGDCYV